MQSVIAGLQIDCRNDCRLPMASPLQLPQAEWEERVRKLRSNAEALGATKPSAAELMALAGVEAVGLLWVGWSPELIAASCRASLLAGVPVVAGLPLGQLVGDAEATVARLQGQGGGDLKVVLQEQVAEPEPTSPEFQHGQENKTGT